MFEQSNDHSFELIYAIFPDEASAKKAAEGLLKDHLVACVNIINHVTSIYRWEGKVCESKEVALIAKTRTEKRYAAQDYLAHHHPYDIPGIISLPILDGHSPYLNWLVKETL